MKKQLFLIFFFSFYIGHCTSSVEVVNPLCAMPTLTNVNPNFNSLTIAWTENGTATSWQVLVLPCGSPTPLPNATGWLPAQTNPFIFFGVVPGTCYSVYVRSDCGLNGVSDWSNPIIVTTPIGPPVCGGNFTDAGGPAGNYPNNSSAQNGTTTICPTNPGEAVTVSFTSFNTQLNTDVLTVYNGNSTSGPLLGVFSGNTLPPSVSSTATNGCLTFVFVSNGTTTAPGWIANVSCSPIVCLAPTNVNVANVSTTSAVLNWTSQGNFGTWSVVVLPFGSPPPTASTTPTYIAQSNPFVATGLVENTCYTAYIRSDCSLPTVWSNPISFCMYDCENNASCLESLNLIAFLDTNNNGIKDPGESFFNYGNFTYQVNNSGPIFQGNSNIGVFNIFDSNSANSYDLAFVVNPSLAPYYSSPTSFNNITLPTGSGANTYYFPVTQLQVYNDLAIEIAPIGQPRPGFSYGNRILYRNNGSNVASGTITFIKNSAVSITSVYPAATTSIPTGFTYNFTNLLPTETRIIDVTMLVPVIPTVNLGDILTNTASITPLTGDAIPNNNSATLSQMVVGSYDPNDKAEVHGGRIPINQFTSNDYLVYTIQFENTGTASAEFVRIEDELNALLNVSTVEVLNASHPYNFRRINNKLIWNFYNINLPPTINNPALSHGFVQFRIKPNSGYGVGTIIPNGAAIYFDYNPPIFTNIYNTEFVAPLRNSDFDSRNFAISPNPATNNVEIQLQNTSETIDTISIVDVLGKTIRSLTAISNNQVQIDVSDFSKGIYFVEVTTSSNLKQVKKLVID